MKPRRKHIDWALFEMSPQGGVFRRTLHAYIGAEFTVSPLELIKHEEQTFHVFAVFGDAGSALIIVPQETREGTLLRHRCAARLAVTRPDLAFDITFDALRWDPWLHAEETGDSLLLTGSPERQSERRFEEDRALATRDRVEVHVSPSESGATALAGLPVSKLENAWAKFDAEIEAIDAEQQSATFAPATSEPASDTLYLMALTIAAAVPNADADDGIELSPIVTREAGAYASLAEAMLLAERMFGAVPEIVAPVTESYLADGRAN